MSKEFQNICGAYMRSHLLSDTGERVCWSIKWGIVLRWVLFKEDGLTLYREFSFALRNKFHAKNCFPLVLFVFAKNEKENIAIKLYKLFRLAEQVFWQVLAHGFYLIVTNANLRSRLKVCLYFLESILSSLQTISNTFDIQLI